MGWTSQSFPFGSLLTSVKMTQMYDNFQAMAQADSGSPTLLAAAGAGRVLLGSLSGVTSLSSIDFTSLISSEYQAYELVAWNIKPSTNAVNPYLRFSTDNGSSFTAAGYYNAWITGDSSGGGAPGGNSAAAGMQLAANVGLNYTDVMDFRCTIFDPLDANYKSKLIAQTGFYSPTGKFAHASLTGVSSDSASHNAMQLIMSSGYIVGGDYQFWGLRGT